MEDTEQKTKKHKGESYYVGVDVGTGSARAGVCNSNGELLHQVSHEIKMWSIPNETVHYEQSSADIWDAVCSAVRGAVHEAGIRPSDVKGIAFDATCSLVVIGKSDEPISISMGGKDSHNVIVWMDHRAAAETNEINATSDEVLQYVGGKVSPEMQVPKLLWLKRHKPDTWTRMGKCLDLSDFLAYTATGNDVRSVCTVACKWTYMSHLAADKGQKSGWSGDFFKSIGLEDLHASSAMGERVEAIGAPIGDLTTKSAEALGLLAGTVVGVGLIDAHSGGIGMLGAQLPQQLGEVALENRLALICGTSSCHMGLSKECRFVPGVWGPYFSAMVPGMWLLEGGQSATGHLLDDVVQTDPNFPALKARAADQGKVVTEELNEILERLCQDRGAEHCSFLTKHLHYLPDFHGNRSPRADPHLKGVVSGLTIDPSLDRLALKYLSCVQSLAYGTRHILQTMNQQGIEVKCLFACGGLSKNRVFIQEHADVLGIPIVLPREPDAVILGAAVAAACAVRVHNGASKDSNQGLVEVMQAMNHVGSVVYPKDLPRKYHDAKFKVFLKMHEHYTELQSIMKDFS